MKTSSLLFTLVFSINAFSDLPLKLPPGTYSENEAKFSFKVSEVERSKIFRRAKVWKNPNQPINQYDFLNGDQSHSLAVSSTDELVCKWLPMIEMDGQMPKFMCSTPNGVILKVKYSLKLNDGEIPSELASTRLLSALGFGADHMFSPKRVRCFGCPKDPWGVTVQLHSAFPEVRKRFYMTNGIRNSDGSYSLKFEFDKFSDFEYVAVEQKLGRAAVRTERIKGWAWDELGLISESAGGSPQHHVEALKLMAAFLQHSDNKSENQRMVCLSDSQVKNCDSVMAIMQDLGATFGKGWGKFDHSKFNVEHWKNADVWSHARDCVVDVKSPKFGTFKAARISEPARLMVSDLLNQLSDQSIEDLFRGARAVEFSGKDSVPLWIEAFKFRRSLISERICPN